MSQIIEQRDINSSQLLMPWSFLREWKARIDLTLTSRGQTHFKSSLALLLRCYFTYLQSIPLLLGKRPYNSTLTFRTGCSGSLRVNYRLCGWLGSKSPNIWWKLNGPFPYWNVYFTACSPGNVWHCIRLLAVHCYCWQATINTRESPLSWDY